MFQFWNNNLFGFEPYFFLLGTDHLLKVEASMEDKVRIKNHKSVFAFFEKFSRDTRTLPLKNEKKPDFSALMNGIRFASYNVVYNSLETSILEFTPYLN